MIYEKLLKNKDNRGFKEKFAIKEKKNSLLINAGNLTKRACFKINK